ncbi:hypothetical protein EON73_02715 [bacterium]|nr:MAG: hypothetical protein EON73_02715 [bacterium]
MVLPINSSTVWMKVSINSDETCQYAYSLDGIKFINIGSVYHTEKGTWIGAKVGLVCLNPNILPSNGYADFDFFRVMP